MKLSGTYTSGGLDFRHVIFNSKNNHIISLHLQQELHDDIVL